MDYREAAGHFKRLLKLETEPVGVSLVARRSQLKRRPLPLKLNICQLLSLARHQGRMATGVGETMVCSLGAACTGLVDTPEQFRDGTAAVGKYVDCEETGRSFFANTFKIGDGGRRFDGIMMAPLESCPFRPDLAVFYCNPAQGIRLIHSCVFDTGEKVAGDTVAEAAVCSSMGYALEHDRPVIGLPCAGDRRYGGTQNHELVFVVPESTLSTRMGPNVLKLAGQGPLYPVPPDVMREVRMPSAYTLEEEDL